jgi:P4 family phage/plasmid primase-like protien
MNQNIRYTIGIQCPKGKELSATPEEFKKLLNQRRRIYLSKGKQDKSVCEYLTSNIPVKMYFDLDCSVATEAEMTTAGERVRDVIARIIEDMEVRFGTELEYVITVYDGVETQESKRSKGENYKVSRHLIFPNLVLSSVADAKRIAEYYKKEADVVDTACYGTTQKFRSVYTPKDEHQKIHRLEDEDADLEDTIIQYNNRQVEVMTKQMVENAYPEFQIKKAEVKEEVKRGEVAEQTNAKLPWPKTLANEVKKLKEHQIATNTYSQYQTWRDVSWALINDFGKTNEIKRIWMEYCEDYYRANHTSETDIDKDWNRLCTEAHKYPYCNYATKIKNAIPKQPFNKEDKLDEEDFWELLKDQIQYNIIIQSDPKKKDMNYYLFDETLGYWRRDTIAVEKYIAGYVSQIAEERKYKHYRSDASIKRFVDYLRLKVCDNTIKFDNIPFYLPCRNGLLNLRTGELRKPVRTDYVSIYVDIDFVAEQVPEDNPCYRAIRRVFVDEDIYKYAMSWYSTGLIGVCIQKIIISTGCGRNGKGFIWRLIKHALGKFAMDGATTLLQSEIKSGANPEYASLGYKRMANFGEPDAGKRFNNETLKKLTGGDDITARGLYDSNVEKENHLTLNIQANTVPKLRKAPSNAELQRVEMIPFDSVFEVGRTEDDYVNKRFPACNEYNTLDWITAQRNTILNLLLPFCMEYLKNNDIKKPIRVVELIRTYFMSCDTCTEWLEEVIEKGTEKDVLKVKELYDVYKKSEAFKSLSIREQRLQTYKGFQEAIQNAGGFDIFLDRKNVICIRGYKYKTDEEPCLNDEEL